MDTDLFPPTPRIDAHTHVFAPAQRDSRAVIAARDPAFAELYADPRAKLATADDLQRAMTGARLDAAVVAGFAFSAVTDIDAQNAHLIETAAAAPGRMALLATVNPARPGWRTEAEAMLRAGAAGFGELRPANQGWDPLGAAGAELCELALAYRAALLWHVSEPVGHSYPGKLGGISPVALIELAVRYPALKMVGAHLGAGAAFYLEMPELRSTIESLYFDTAASSLLYHKKTVARVVDLAGPERVLFGSDFPLLSPARQLEAIEAALPDERVRAAVCGGNAGAFYFPSRLAESTGVSRSGA